MMMRRRGTGEDTRCRRHGRLEWGDRLRTVMPGDHLLAVLILQHPAAAAAGGEAAEDNTTLIESLIAFVGAILEAMIDPAGDDAGTEACFEAWFLSISRAAGQGRPTSGPRQGKDLPRLLGERQSQKEEIQPPFPIVDDGMELLAEEWKMKGQ